MEIKTNKLILISKLARAISKETGVSFKLSDADVMDRIDEAMQTVDSIETKGLYAKLIGENIASTETTGVMYRGNTTATVSTTQVDKVKKKKVMYRGRTL